MKIFCLSTTLDFSVVHNGSFSNLVIVKKEHKSQTSAGSVLCFIEAFLYDESYSKKFDFIESFCVLDFSFYIKEIPGTNLVS
jgi:hypothetical protein